MRESNAKAAFLLSNEGKAGGFSIVCDNRHNITLLKCSKPIAWFSAAVTQETLRAFLETIKYCDGNAKHTM